MSLQSWSETLITAQVDGNALASSTTATSILPTSAKFTLPSNFFAIGKELRITAAGRISTTTGPPSITFDIRLGGVAIFTGGAVTTVASVTNLTWRFQADLTCRSIGGASAATLLGTGWLLSSAVVGSSGGNAGDAALPNASPAVGTGFDSTLSQQVDLYATWSASSASNSILLHQFKLESVN